MENTGAEMHTLAEFRTLFTYNDWANDRLIAMLNRAFGEETTLTDIADTRAPAIQQTVVHLIGAQAIWRLRWQGHSPSTPLDAAEYPTPLALRMAMGAERARFWGFFEGLQTDADLETAIPYRTMQGDAYTHSLAEMLHHVLLHSMYHRGQVTARLIDMGHESVLLFTDYIAFTRDTT